MSTMMIGCTTAATEPVVEPVVAVEEAVEEVFGVHSLALGDVITDEMLIELGEVVDHWVAPSCHYDGSDDIYIYENFTLYTYQDQGAKYLYIIEFTAPEVATAEGAYVGMTRDELIAIYGEDFEEMGIMLSWPLLDEEGEVLCTLSATIGEEGTVEFIEMF